jgi:hypothetical protein
MVEATYKDTKMLIDSLDNIHTNEACQILGQLWVTCIWNITNIVTMKQIWFNRIWCKPFLASQVIGMTFSKFDPTMFYNNSDNPTLPFEDKKDECRWWWWVNRIFKSK